MIRTVAAHTAALACMSCMKITVNLQHVKFTTGSETSNKSEKKIDNHTHYVSECCPHGTFAGQQIK